MLINSQAPFTPQTELKLKVNVQHERLFINQNSQEITDIVCKAGNGPGHIVLWKNTETIVNQINFYDFKIYRQIHIESKSWLLQVLNWVKENNN